MDAEAVRHLIRVVPLPKKMPNRVHFALMQRIEEGVNE
jgi:hypothetical protein